MQVRAVESPPYSPDLATSDYYRNSKSYVCRTRFSNDDELNAATGAWFEEQTDDFYFKGICFLKEKWAKCIEEKQDYTLSKISNWSPYIVMLILKVTFRYTKFMLI